MRPSLTSLDIRLPITLVLFSLFAGANAQHDCKASKRYHQHHMAKGGGGMDLWPMDIIHQRVHLDLTLGNVIAGVCDVAATPRIPGLDQLALHLLDLTVDSVTTTEGTLNFNHEGELLVIDLIGIPALGDTIALSIHYQGDPATDPSGFGGFYTSTTYIYNLGVAFQSIPHSYGRAWFPCVDNFTERNTYEFFIKTHAGRNAWCNGELISETQLGGDTLMRHWRKDLPIPTYLASVAAADYVAVRDTFTSLAELEIPVALVARAQDTTNLKNSFLNLPGAFDHFENWFGPFRWNKVGYVVTPQGAMEHSTSIHYPASIVNGNLQYENIMAHELAHEWFGNLVTCERAEEMYINEGFAEYLSYLFLEHIYGRDRYMTEVRANHRKMVHRAHLLDEGWWALADIPQQWTYGEHSYNKGADMIHTLRGYLGDELFQQGLTSFLAAHEFQPVNSTMLRDHLTTSTGVDMYNFFNDFILQPGWAAFEVDSFVVMADYITTIHLQQKLHGANEFYNNVPLTIAAVDADGNRWESPERIMAGGANSTATISPPFTPVAIVLNADELISLAITADEDTITQTGNRTYTTSNIRLTTTQLAAPLPIRIEQYWVAADPEAQEDHAYRISPDRWWRIVGNIPAGTTINGRIEYDGRPTTTGSLDIGLMEDFGGLVFREDSLVLLYRPDQRSPWMLHLDFTVQTLNNPTDKWGRIEFNNVLAGEYTLAWHTSPVGVQESSMTSEWAIYPNPAVDHVTVTRTSGSGAGMLELLDRKGRLVRWQPVTSDQVEMRVQGIAAGNYHLRFRGRDGGTMNVGNVVVVR